MPSFEWLLFGFLVSTVTIFIKWFDGSDVPIVDGLVLIVGGTFLGPVTLLVVAHRFFDDRTNIGQLRIKGRK